MQPSTKGAGLARFVLITVREVDMRFLSASFLAILALPLVSACGNAERPVPIRRLLLETIVKEAHSAGVEIDSSRVQWTIEPSAVAQGVVFGRAHYARPNASHIHFIVAAVERQGRSTLITDQKVVSAALRAETPPDSARAIGICSEFVRWVNGAEYSRGVPEVYATDTSWRTIGFVDPGPPWRSVAMPPTARFADLGAGAPGWVVAIWVVVPGSLKEFECLIGADGLARAAINDSLPHAGSVPENP